MKMEKLLGITEAMCTNVAEGYNINTIAKLARIDVATTYRILKEMEKRNEVMKSKKGNNLFYRINLGNTSALKYCELASIERRKRFLLRHPEMINLAAKAGKNAEVLLLFGSMARGEKKPRDIDLLVIYEGRHNAPDAEPLGGGKISPIFMGREEFVKKMRERNAVVASMLMDGVLLRGEDVFWKIVGSGCL
ncbi:MAG: nucleotidyltransferase domain-containing protein [Candidatus Aenigmarchaeota archaeon]|nr:nucleotidyltransferase domain-containing protein [Candidatus Aenigmarchaeota archaeon]